VTLVGFWLESWEAKPVKATLKPVTKWTFQTRVPASLQESSLGKVGDD